MLYELPEFKHVDAGSLEEAVYWLRACPGKARIVAGGTDLFSIMKDRTDGPGFKTPEVLVNVKTIPAMSRIVHKEGEGLTIGAAVTLAGLLSSDAVREKVRILADAAALVGTTQLRNMGTVGGNLCQRPRCLYFRHPDFPCFKKGGKRCYAAAGEHRFYHAIFENGRCCMAHPSDMATVLVALQAALRITGPSGSREVPLRRFFARADDPVETQLASDELLAEIVVPFHSAGRRGVFLKERVRKAADFAIASVAVSAQMEGDVCREVGIILGGVAPAPYAAIQAEEMMKGKRVDSSLIEAASKAAVEQARPLRSNRYKVDLTRVLVQRALALITQQC